VEEGGEQGAGIFYVELDAVEMLPLLWGKSKNT
jgi:hypothetical protein